MKKIKELMDTPITWGSSLKASGVSLLITAGLVYTEYVHLGWLPSPKEIAIDLKDKVMDR